MLPLKSLSVATTNIGVDAGIMFPSHRVAEFICHPLYSAHMQIMVAFGMLTYVSMNEKFK